VTVRLPEVSGRVSLREQVAAALRTALISGQLQPGITYSIPTLAEQLGVSATPVREAMLDFVQQGIVAAVPNKGFRVIEHTDADLDALTEVRRMLEIPAIERACDALTAEQIAELRLIAEQVRDAAAAGDLVGYLEGDREFHLRILAAAGNPRLVSIVDDLRTQSRLYALSDLAADGTLVASADEHLALLDALAAGDSTVAASLMGHHLDHVRGSWARANG
jgi:DNA-binding GntR family transcriptional regulator